MEMSFESEKPLDRRTTFPFFKLPAELREEIYQLAFAYPKSGILVPRVAFADQEPFQGIHALTWSHEMDFSFAQWYGEQALRSEGLVARPIPEILAQLLVCRQFYQEAMPVFYRTNHFHASSVRDLVSFLQRAGPDRRRHIGHISTKYHLREMSSAAEAFDLLSQVEYLRKLDIWLPEHEWQALGKMGYGGHVRKYFEGIPIIPGLTNLRSIKVDDVDFHGSCPLLEQMLKNDMLKLRTRGIELEMV